MAIAKSAEYVVVHPSLYLSVGGVLQQMECGTVVSLTPATAKTLVDRGMIQPKGAEKKTTLDADNHQLTS